MKCFACGRRILTPTYVGLGGYLLGPTCARRAGLLKPKRRPVMALPVDLQAGQLELFLKPDSESKTA